VIYCRYFAAAALFLCSAASLRAGNTVLPQNVAGLRARLEIVRDRQGVPHIRAANEPDALFGLGFVHAQDRLWQLEFLRRVGRGRLAEVLGPSAIDRDKMFRTLGIAQSASATWAHYLPEHRTLINSYVAGLNAAMEQQRRNGLPPEFVILNFEPEPWRAEDVFVLAKVLGWSVDRNWNQELLRMQVVQKVGESRAAQLMPAYTADGPIILPQSRVHAERELAVSAPRLDEDFIARLAAFEREVAESSGAGGPGIGSNNQVLSGARTTTGKPVLAADPHLPSQIPAVFYRAHITGGRLDAIGATVAGLPGIVMGHNGRIAWGWTNANADVQDLYLERIYNGVEVAYNGTREPLQFRREIIRVKGQNDVLLTVRSTRHGPLVSDLIDPDGPALALQWAALDSDDDIGIAAYLEANRATNWTEFTSAFRRFKAHSQNLLYADRDGNIAYLLAGTIPVRTASDGTVPVPGWTPAFEWKGYVPFDELPVSLNPQQGYLASSNNKIAPDGYPYPLGSSFAAPYRAMRVREVLSGTTRFSPQDLERLQADVLAVHARELLPYLLRVTPESNTERQALELLRRWNYRMTPESAAAAVFEAWYIQLAESLFADELGDDLWRTYSDQLHMVSMAASSAIRTDSPWCDDVTTTVRETCASTASSALRLALRRMAVTQGTGDVGAWQWSKVHHTVFFHQPFDADPVLASRFNRTVPNGGDKHTVNVASNTRWTDYNQRHVALYRQVIDLSNFTNSRWMAAPGQSGIVSDVHYDDLIDEWQRVDYDQMLYTRQAVDEHAVARIELRP
jgi:penicillin amidase